MQAHHQHVCSGPTSPAPEGLSPPDSPRDGTYVDALAKKIKLPFEMPANGYRWSRRESRRQHQEQMVRTVSSEIFINVPKAIQVPVLMKLSEGFGKELLLTRLAGDPLFTKLLNSMVFWARTRVISTKAEFAKTLAWFDKCLKFRKLRTYDAINSVEHLKLMSELVTLFLDNRVCRFNLKVRIFVHFAQLYPDLMKIVQDDQLPESLLPLAARIFEAKHISLKSHYPTLKEASTYSVYLHTWLRHSKLPRVEAFLIPFIPRLPFWFNYFLDSLPETSQTETSSEQYTFISSHKVNPFHPGLILSSEVTEVFLNRPHPVKDQHHAETPEMCEKDGQKSEKCQKDPKSTDFSEKDPKTAKTGETTTKQTENTVNPVICKKAALWTCRVLRGAQQRTDQTAEWVFVQPRKWLSKYRKGVFELLSRDTAVPGVYTGVLETWMNYMEAELMYLEDSERGKAAFKSGFEEMHPEEIQEWATLLLHVFGFLAKQTEFFQRYWPRTPYVVAQHWMRKFVNFLDPLTFSRAISKVFGQSNISHAAHLLPTAKLDLHDRWDCPQWIQLGDTLFSPEHVVRFAESANHQLFLHLPTQEKNLKSLETPVNWLGPQPWSNLSAAELMHATRDTQPVRSLINNNIATCYNGSSMVLSRYTRFHKKSPILLKRFILGVHTTTNHNWNTTPGGHYLFIWRATNMLIDTDWWLLNQQTKKVVMKGKTKLDIPPPQPGMISDDPRFFMLPKEGPAIVLCWPTFEQGRGSGVSVQINLLKSRFRDVARFDLPERICHCKIFDFIGPWMLVAVGYTLYAFDWRKMSTPKPPGSDSTSPPSYHKIPLILGEVCHIITNPQKHLVIFVPKVGNSIAIMDVSNPDPTSWKTVYVQVIQPKYSEFEVGHFNKAAVERDPYFQLSAVTADPSFKYLFIQDVSRLKYMVFLEEPIKTLRQLT